jgi:chromodomain-helicase-DNA-binding protein 4
MVTVRRPLRAKRKRAPGFINLDDIDMSSDEFGSIRSKPRRLSLTFRQTERSIPTQSDTDSESVAGHTRKRRAATRSERKPTSRHMRPTGPVNYIDHIGDDSQSSDAETARKGRGRPPKPSDGSMRRSERSGIPRKSMRERLEDDIPDAERPLSKGPPKVSGIRENFVRLLPSNDFRRRHLEECDTCNGIGDSNDKGPLVFCQGCTLAYHSTCLGSRKGRAHLVSKIGEDEFVLQCRRCIEVASKNEPSAPHQGRCQSCHVTGAACAPFQARKTAKQEQEERETNNGQDPVVSVPSHLVNDPKNVLFRCTSCFQAFHVHHLVPRKEVLFQADDEEEKAKKRWIEYSEDWTCHDCRSAKAAVGGLVAWRPRDPESYVFGTGFDDVCEDDKEYLIKWHNKSYNQSEWMPGPWVWGITHKAMRISFSRRDNGRCLPKMRTEDAIPEEYLRIDIVFQVEYNNIVQERIEEVDLARVTEVERAQVKFKGLGYEDTVWERPPDPVQDPERWADFKAAYEDWVRGNYLKPPPSSTLSTHLRKVRALNFTDKVLLKEQPKSLSGGELMDYQLDGINWIYYQWHKAHNAILADEMGLGKTIQVIGFMTTLVEKFNYWPFLVVVPNATCANWRREIKTWAPGLRVVTYFGSAKARELSERYELFTSGNKKELRCHVVVTSYDAVQDPSCQTIFKRIAWASLVVDEGQRLKNDKNILYHALSQLRTPFKLLLTGTPLQNNQRELFNLLQFLDSSKNAEELEKKYEVLTKDAVAELHELLRPFFLRRTKAQVLKFLPTMAQVIVPVSMTALQKQLYKSILGKNADLLKSIFGGERRYASKGGLRNILMQLRKCLCHPFVYSIAIEERSTEAAISHRRLVEASSKLQLLEIMLPKLQERGHRVLIFSQFLDMLTVVEDFLQGLSLEHVRLDGTMGSMEKQKCIDKFNAPDSNIFAFLLSTRAGGVGINLATADTVIILDPDFNPHQDIQAISRAHRIGQKKKVLIFQMMTRGSAEEKIMQIGKKKMALDHVLIEAMGDEDPDGNDLEDVLRFGAEALFKDDGSSDIHYDPASVDKLLDRSVIEDTKTGADDSAESQFSFARVWQNDTASMGDQLGGGEDGEHGANPTVWDAILEERARQAQHERDLKEANLGRGKRQRKNVDYHGQVVPGESHEDGSENDTDFQAREEPAHENSSTAGSADEGDASKLADELRPEGERIPKGKILSTPQAKREFNP